jgi:RimJ/RimL family protein N-acetyltransferase
MPFDLQPTLQGELLELRPLHEEDFDALYAVASDPFVWEQHPQRDRYKEEVFREFFRSGMDSGGALVAIDSKTHTIIGSSRFQRINRRTKYDIEIGWTFLARAYWGGSYNGEMKRLMLEHAFQFVDRVLFYIGSRNIRSQKAIEKIGGIRLAWKTDDNNEVSFIYEIRRTSFDAS